MQPAFTLKNPWRTINVPHADCLYVLTVSPGIWIWHQVLVGGLTALAYVHGIQEETVSQTDPSVGANENEYGPGSECEAISRAIVLSGPGRGNLRIAGLSAATRSARAQRTSAL